MSKKHHILIVEDEPAIHAGLADVFIYHGYDVTVVEDGDRGVHEGLSGRYDLILLDVMLPRRSGFEVCEAVRARYPAQPIVMLTAKISDADIVAGLRLGADDYVTKPFSVEQLVLRVAAVLRRADRGASGSTSLQSLSLVPWQVDVQTLSAVHDSGEVIKFTKREMEVLLYLADHHERPVPREELLANVWGYSQSELIETRTVDIHIAKIRKKIEADASQPALLQTVRGAGYRLVMQH